jgi:RNAse (barnase) inhibitor barstar
MNAAGPRPGSLDALPAQTLRRLGPQSVDELRRWAEQAGQRFALAECSDCVDKKAVLKAIGRALEFPDWYGANLDALYDCLTDLPERGDQGWVLVLERLPVGPRFDGEQRDALLDVFRDAGEVFADRGVPLRVFYS